MRRLCLRLLARDRNPCLPYGLTGGWISTSWLIDPSSVLWAIAAVAIWSSVSISMGIILASMQSIPLSFYEAAILDGASQYQIFFQIMMPLAKPGLIAMGIFNFLGQWDQFLLPLVLMPDENTYLLSHGLYFLAVQQGYQNDYGALFAAMVITMVSTLIIYVLFQPRLEAGLTAGALKG